MSRKKSQKVSDSHRNDVSPLTQGLRYRTACDFGILRTSNISFLLNLALFLHMLYSIHFGK